MQEHPKQPEPARASIFPLVIFMVIAAGLYLKAPGMPEFYFRMDNDSTMRLVMIRDLLEGQGWYDMTQARLGLEGGFEMHWSRIVDAPIAALILVAKPVVGPQGAEIFATTFWPLLLLGLVIWVIARLAAWLGNATAVFFTTLLAGMVLGPNVVFRPGAIDHHNIQILLLFMALLGAFGRSRPHLALVSGAAIAASLSIGVETLPLLALIASGMAVFWLFDGEHEKAATIRFGTALAVVTSVLFVSVAPRSAWSGGYCDAVSIDLAVPVILGGAGLAIAAFYLSERGVVSRLLAIAVLGALLGVTTFAVLPACMSNPLDALDPFLHARWLDFVTEAQGLPDVIAGNVPRSYLGYYVMALGALAISVVYLRLDHVRRSQWALLSVLLALSLALSVFQLRSIVAASLLAILPIGHLIGGLRDKWQETGRGLFGLLALVLLVGSIPFAWSAVREGYAKLTRGADATAPAMIGHEACFNPGALAALAAEPVGVLSANSNIGAQLLLQTPHRTLAAPYHRNQSGMIAQLEISLAEDAEAAYSAIKNHAVDYVVVCPGDPELRLLLDRGYSGWGIALERGDVPDFLQLIDGTELGGMQVYRVR